VVSQVAAFFGPQTQTGEPIQAGQPNAAILFADVLGLTVEQLTGQPTQPARAAIGEAGELNGKIQLPVTAESTTEDPAAKVDAALQAAIVPILLGQQVQPLEKSVPTASGDARIRVQTADPAPVTSDRTTGIEITSVQSQVADKLQVAVKPVLDESSYTETAEVDARAPGHAKPAAYDVPETASRSGRPVEARSVTAGPVVGSSVQTHPAESVSATQSEPAAVPRMLAPEAAQIAQIGASEGPAVTRVTRGTHKTRAASDAKAQTEPRTDLSGSTDSRPSGIASETVEASVESKPIEFILRDRVIEEMPVKPDEEAKPESVDEARFALIDNGAERSHGARAEEVRRNDLDNRTVELHRRVIDQIVREVRVRKLDGNSEMIVRLNPPELGEIRLSVVQEGQSFASTIQTTSEQVRGLLQAHLPALTEALADAGVKMNSISVASSGSFGALMNDAGQPSGEGYRREHRHTHTARPGFGPVEAVAAGATRVSGTSGTTYSWLA